MRIELPISKSIANRLLILQATHGDELMPVSDSMPDDVRIMSEAIGLLGERREARIDLGNCGTAMRFLTAYCAQLEGQTIILDGVERMHHRPIGQLVDALREIGADIEYLGEEGFPPLRIKGCILDKHRIVTINNPLSTQYISALLLIGANVITNSTSPYIYITQEVIKQYQLSPFSYHLSVEKDWSSAAFWYEYVALHGGEITLPGLSRDSLQGDKVVADIFAHLGVQTTYTPEGVVITKNNNDDSVTQQHKQLNPTTLRGNQPPAAPCRSRELIRAKVVDIVVDNTLSLDFANCPDLYPAIALTCERLGVELHATGVESLPLKESDRLRAVAEHRTDADHRMAMALLIAGYEVDDTACISKSYPNFIEHFRHINSLK